MRVWILILVLLAGPVAVADQKADCGTIVLPVGIGETSPDDLTAFNPLYVQTAYNEEAAWTLFPNLIWVNRFGDIDWSRSLASSVTTSDNVIFTITMRPWHWSDGVPLSAEDVAYTFGLVKALGPQWTGYGSGGMPDIVKAVNVLNATQLQVITTRPVNPTWFIYNGIGGLEPVPEHKWKHYTLDQMYQLQSTPSFFDVVDGPLKIQRLDVGQDAVFAPNPAWEGPKMHFSRLVFKFLAGDGTAVQGVEAGDTDAAMLPSDLWNSVQNLPGIRVVLLQQLDFENVINLNFKNPKVAFFGDVRVRQAMEDAINQPLMVSTMFHGAGVVALGPVPADLPRFLPPEMQAGHYPVGYDPAKSRALLAQAGYSPGPDGIMRKDGKRLSFTFWSPTGSDTLNEEAEFLQSDLAKVGIEMKIQQMEFNQMMSVMSSEPAGWEAAGTGMPALPYPSGEGQFATGAYQNLGHYSDPAMDRMIDESVKKPGLDGLFAYESYFSQQLPVIFFATSLPIVLERDRLHGIADFVNPAGMYAPDQLYCTVGAGAEK